MIGIAYDVKVNFHSLAGQMNIYLSNNVFTGDCGQWFTFKLTCFSLKSQPSVVQTVQLSCLVPLECSATLLFLYDSQRVF